MTRRGSGRKLPGCCTYALHVWQRLLDTRDGTHWSNRRTPPLSPHHSMPRRSRPAHRKPPKTSDSLVTQGKTIIKHTAAQKQPIRSEPDLSEDDHVFEQEVSSDEFEEGSSQGSGRLNGQDNDDEDEDADAPRVVQWEEDMEDFVEDEEAEEEEDLTNEKTLQNNLQDLPLGALRRAQLLLSHAEPEGDSDSASDSDEGSATEEDTPEVHDVKGKGKEKERVEWSIKPRNDISKRSSKHAPMEVTSKRPVSRRRTVVEAPKIVPRDPRFLATAGEFDATKFQKSYGFLSESHKTELQTLKETLKQARKRLVSSPRDLRSEHEHEVHRLEQAMKRAESAVNKDRLDKVGRNALSKAKKEEQEKRKEGKGHWFLKKVDKQKLLVKARYEALAQEGGQRAVQKAIEKKQKKESQKEKRSRPYAKGEQGGSRKRGPEADAPWPRKRQRV
ncbi:unnamed protein product [Cyclocybe aegerita]|uniref:rRNA biogenesis protein RRP36 n=1 Tax=Cyclocybe aegerita TaxID=1973307 RepID=A0A8S0WDG7_CYCAE|nr:unnamed protein product [Cyclocybe aegerita]